MKNRPQKKRPTRKQSLGKKSPTRKQSLGKQRGPKPKYGATKENRSFALSADVRSYIEWFAGDATSQNAALESIVRKTDGFNAFMDEINVKPT